MKSIASFLLGCILLSIDSTVTAQGDLPNGFRDDFIIEKSCANNNSGCRLTVALQCLYRDVQGNLASCLDRERGNRAFLTLSKAECSTRRNIPAKISYRMCNDNNLAFTPIAFKNNIRFRKERSVKPGGWDDTLAANTCREHMITEEIDLCKETRVVDVEMDGNLAKARPNYCRCYLYKESNLNLFTPSPTKAPTKRPTRAPTKRPTRAPTESPTKRPTRRPVARATRYPTRYPTRHPTDYPTRHPTDYPTRYPTGYPTRRPTPSPCNLFGVVITELASPFNNRNGRFIELYFGRLCGNYRITKDLYVLRWPKGSQTPSPWKIPLKGRTIPPDGFMVLCMAYEANTIYGPGTCDVVTGPGYPADVDGTDTIAVVEDTPPTIRYIDVFGYPGGNGDGHDFTGGRAVRKFPFKAPDVIWRPFKWHIIPGPLTAPGDYDPNKWVPYTPKPKDRHLIITEIVDNPGKAVIPPRFVEIYAPRNEDRIQLANEAYSIVIYEGSSSIPYWESAIPIRSIKPNGFYVACNPAAYALYGYKCDGVFNNVRSPANSDGDDQIAIVKGSPSNYKVVDIFGRIGEDGDIFTEHNFNEARALRKLNVTEPKDNWSPYDWYILRGPATDPDPNEWKEPPVTKDPCIYFFTEFSDPINNQHADFIEIKSTCPGTKIPDDMYVKTWKNPIVTVYLNQIGTVPQDGFIIICRNRDIFQQIYAKTCDIEHAMIQPDGKYSVALMDNTGILDIYGIPYTLLPAALVFTQGRAYRKLDAPKGTKACAPRDWVVVPGDADGSATTDDADPRDWKVAPMKIFFTEFADPNGNPPGRFVELYSPNRRDYLITENLYIFRHDSTTETVLGTFLLKGKWINGQGFIVICGKYFERCNVEAGEFSIFNSPGVYAWTLQLCDNGPDGNCERVDNYGLGCFSDGYSYMNGRAVRKFDAEPKPSPTFYITHWHITVPTTHTDPGEWDPNDVTPPSPPSSPSAPSKGYPSSYKNKPSKNKRRRRV